MIELNGISKEHSHGKSRFFNRQTIYKLSSSIGMLNYRRVAWVALCWVGSSFISRIFSVGNDICQDLRHYFLGLRPPQGPSVKPALTMRVTRIGFSLLCSCRFVWWFLGYGWFMQTKDLVICKSPGCLSFFAIWQDLKFKTALCGYKRSLWQGFFRLPSSQSFLIFFELNSPNRSDTS